MRHPIVVLTLLAAASYVLAGPAPARVRIGGPVTVADPGPGWKISKELDALEERTFEHKALRTSIDVAVFPVKKGEDPAKRVKCIGADGEGEEERCVNDARIVMARRAFTEKGDRDVFVFLIVRAHPEWEIAIHASWPVKNDAAASAALDRMVESVSF